MISGLSGIILFAAFCFLVAGADASSSVGSGLSSGDEDHAGGTGWQGHPVFGSGHLAGLSACEEEENEDDDDPLASRAIHQFFGQDRGQIVEGCLGNQRVPLARRYLLYCRLKIDC